MTNKTIRIRPKQLNILFPDEFTKMREEDFLTKGLQYKHILNKREFDTLINLKGNLHDKINRNHFEFIVKKKKGKIELIPFD